MEKLLETKIRVSWTSGQVILASFLLYLLFYFSHPSMAERKAERMDFSGAPPCSSQEEL